MDPNNTNTLNLQTVGKNLNFLRNLIHKTDATVKEVINTTTELNEKYEKLKIKSDNSHELLEAIRTQNEILIKNFSMQNERAASAASAARLLLAESLEQRGLLQIALTEQNKMLQTGLAEQNKLLAEGVKDQKELLTAVRRLSGESTNPQNSRIEELRSALACIEEQFGDILNPGNK